MVNFIDLFSGLFDEHGNPLFDQSGNPINPGGSPKAEPDWNSLYIAHDADKAAALASGMSDADWVGSDKWAEYRDQVHDSYRSSTDLDKLRSDRDWQLANKGDEVYGASYGDMANTIQNRIDFLENPLGSLMIYLNGSTTRNEGQIAADRAKIHDESARAYDNLLSFQREQASYTRELADQIRLSREFAIPRLPERNGSFVAGGAAMKDAAPRTGLPDLLIRY